MQDLYQAVTNKIIAALEAGTPPWIRAWTRTSVSSLPVNASSKRAYRGINVVLLMMEAMIRGYTENSWLTYLQASELGGRVRAGSHGTTVIFYKQREVRDAESDQDDSPRTIPLLRAFTVFNLDQITGLPAHMSQPVEPPSWNPLERAESLLAASGAEIRHGGNRASYDPHGDHIQLPERASFPDAGCFYATALHELSHWSGAPSRLNRDLKGRFGDSAYAMEELIAEMSSAFLCASLGIEGKLQHAAYVSSWLNIMKQDKRAVFTAAAKAQAAADFLLSAQGLVQDRSPEEVPA